MSRHQFIECPWYPFKQQILIQWRKLTEDDLREAGRDRHALAHIIERKYGIAWQLAESYLRNLEAGMQRYPAAA